MSQPHTPPLTAESGDVDNDVGPTPAAVCDGGGEEGGREGGGEARTDNRTPEVRGQDDLVCVCSICCIHVRPAKYDSQCEEV